MRFDDRLRTVLNHRADGKHARAVRWRQLVELLARGGSLEGSALAAEAIALVASEAAQVDEDLRAAAARAIAALPLPIELITLFAGESLKVSAPILAAAQLSPDQWSAVKGLASPEAIRFIDALHPAANKPVSGPPAESPREPEPDLGGALTPSIKDVIDRIDAIRTAREEGSNLPPGSSASSGANGPANEAAHSDREDLGLFRWECGPSGEVEWVEGAPRAALIGRALVEHRQDRESGSREIARAFAVRAPFSNAVVTLAEDTSLAGQWELSGMPAFDHVSGRFAGYRGIAKRSHRTARPSERSAAPHPDTLRELVHEIKTPLNAIMGFAEIIQGQMFGPAGTSYRGRAAEIVAQARLLLTAIDDLDEAARSRSRPAHSLTNVGQLVERVTPEIRKRAAERDVAIDASRTTRDLPTTVAAELVERLILRLCNAVLERAEPGERVRILVDRIEDQCRVSVSRPAVLQGLSDEALFGPTNTSFTGLGLRLARGLAQIGGVEFVTTADSLVLNFPCSVLGDVDRHGYGASAGRGL